MTLYIIGTPIGNLKDMTFRAVDTLRGVEVVIVEKWSDSIKLLNHFDIRPRQLLTYDENNRNRVTPKILDILKVKDAAYITSSGMPGVSDPAADLVRRCRENKISIIPIPGPSALTAAISVCGFRGPFLFVGFLPQKISHRKKIFEEAKKDLQNVVFFESPFRVQKTLKELDENFPDVEIFLGKEMTKKFETYSAGSPAEMLEKFSADERFSKGEFTLIASFPDTSK